MYFIIDFDSTFVTTEGLEEYANIVLDKKKDKKAILEKIKSITKQGMEGQISFEKSLISRMKLLSGTKRDIEKTATALSKKITPSVKRNKSFFKKYSENIYIVSGGFREFIIPVVSPFGIGTDHVIANSFIFDKTSNITGYTIAHKKSKADAVYSLGLKGEIFAIGDGYTDYEIKKMGAAKHFTAFTENVARETVIKKADKVANTFDEFLFVNKLPMTISYPKSKIKVIILEHIDKIAVDLFEKEGYAIDYVDKPISDSVFFEKIKQSTILGIRSRTHIDKELLKYTGHMLAVGAYCIGTNQIDLDECANRGIAVFNAPYSNTRSVVELIMGEIIMLQRRIFEKSNNLHKGIWDKTAIGSHEIRGRKLGIIGYGNIGSQLSVLAEAFGMEVYFYDTMDKLTLGNAKKCRSMKELLHTSDIITIHVDGNKNNTNLIGKREFEWMKPGAIFLNASRGVVVDIKAFCHYLKTGKIAGAAIDVFPYEPKSKKEPFISELRNIPNVILTPHIGGSTEEAQKNIAEYVTAKIIEFINTGQTAMSVNFPAINQPKLKNTHRLLHLHRNVPGILARINSILAENHINIEGQYLKTNEHVGYVVTDVDKKYDANVLKELKQIPDTIRFRVLY